MQMSELDRKLWPLAQAMLMSGPKATPPKARAIRKMIRYLKASPLHFYTQRHERGTWRSWPKNIGGHREELSLA